MTQVFDTPESLPTDLLSTCRQISYPARLLMCPPDEFEVLDVKNPHMEGNIGRVDRTAAREQWQRVKQAFEASGATVELLAPVKGCEDMVFCANQTLVGLNGAGQRCCLLSHMKHPSRQREVPAFAEWFRSAGYEIVVVPGTIGFEGSGDAIWQPGRGLIWGGYGHRSDREIYSIVARRFDVPVIRLRLLSERFYHLDTCFCAIDERTVLIDARSLEPQGVEMIRKVFEQVIEVPPEEADRGMACNAAAVGGRHVVIQSGNAITSGRLRALGYTVHEVETSEFLKSGGSVFCMKMYVW